MCALHASVLFAKHLRYVQAMSDYKQQTHVQNEETAVIEAKEAKEAKKAAAKKEETEAEVIMSPQLLKLLLQKNTL